jgi:hypothetical protein
VLSKGELMLSNAKFRCLCAVTMSTLGCQLPDDPLLDQAESSLESQLTRLRAYNDATNNYYAMNFTGTFAFHRVYIDTDENSATGFSYCGLGADYLIENSSAHHYTGTGANWSWSSLGSSSPTINSSGAAWTIARSTFGESAFPNRARMCFETKTATDVKDTSAIYTHVYSNETLAIHRQLAYNDATQLFYQAYFDVAVSHKHAFIDSDENAATGYATGGIGADYMVENNSVYDYTGDGSTWSWTNLGASNMSPSTSGATGTTTWTFARSLIGETGTSERADLVWHGSPTAGGSSIYTAIYDHIYSGGSASPPPTGTIEETGYASDPNNELRNPERGIYHGDLPTPSDYWTLVPEWLWLHTVCDDYLTWNGYNAQGTSAILNDYVRLQLLPARAVGAKVIFRPRYDNPSGNGPSACTINGYQVFHADRPSGSTGSAQLAIQKNHIDAIAAMLGDYKDVIGFIQAGYLGRWGEWNTNDHPDETAPFLYDDALRAELIDYVLAKYEQHGIKQDVGLRRPVFAKEVTDRDADANVGLHSDCYMTNSSDGGTYSDFEDVAANFGDEELAKSWAENFTSNASFGGETCDLWGTAAGTERWRSCSNVLAEMPDIHVNYINGDYSGDAIDEWSAGQCFDDVLRNLGYRFKVTRVVYTPSATPGGSFTVNVDVVNSGWAKLQKPREAKLVLRGPTTQTYLPSNRATENWAPGQPITLSFTGTAPAAGVYSVRLAIPDPDAPTNKNYAIKLATVRNGVNVFETATGENNLGVSINVQ